MRTEEAIKGRIAIALASILSTPREESERTAEQNKLIEFEWITLVSLAWTMGLPLPLPSTEIVTWVYTHLFPERPPVGAECFFQTKKEVH